MIQKISVILFCAFYLLPGTVLAANHEVFAPGLTLEYELPVNVPQVFSNVFLWTVKGNCTIISDTEDNPIQVRAKRGTGAINNTDIQEGDTLLFNVKNGENLFLLANSGSQVELTNQGEKTIKARCSSA